MSEPGEAIFTEHLGFIMVEYDPPNDQTFLCVQGIVEKYVRLHNEDKITKYRLRLLSNRQQTW